MKRRVPTRIPWPMVLVCVLGWHDVAAAGSQEKWMLMSRHGDCEEIQTLRHEVPHLTTISDVQSLLDFFESHGHFVNSKQLPGSAGRAYQVQIADLSLNLVVVRESLCAKR